MPTNVIPKGYRVTIVSWENDGDNYSTIVLPGLSREYTGFLVKFANIFKSHEFGNLYEPSEAVKENLAAIVSPLIKDSYEAIKNQYSPEWSVDFDNVAELLEVIGEEMGTIHGYSDFYSRVTESVIVEHFPEDVHINDITAEFV